MYLREMGEIRIGLCSWTDKSLLESGAFYPPGVDDPEGRLRYYGSHFPLVEVDSSYYALPSERNSRLWVERTPDGFTFNVKAYSLFTNHPTRTYSLPKGLFKGSTSTMCRVKCAMNYGVCSTAP